MPAFFFALFPAVILGAIAVLRKHYVFYAYFIINYFIMGLNRYIPIKSGMSMFVLGCALLVFLLTREIMQQQEWKRCKNFLTWSWGIWFLYCFLEVFNPRAMLAPWTIAFPSYAFYPILCAIVVPVLFTRNKNFQWLLILWAGLTLLAAAKGYWQRNRGFDPTELHWLFVEGGSRTHIIHSGIRFFSFFSDAASYGASMGLSLVVFGISGFYTRKRWMKLLFWATALSAAYGLMISGTRSAIAVPFVGLLVYLIMCRNIKAIIITLLILAGAFVFFKYTTIGDNNRIIHRMRTSFDFEDASWQSRVYNKRRIYSLMQDKPFGTGLGLAGTKGERFRPTSKYDPLTYLATDSGFVMTYVETGIVGLIIYVAVLIAILLKAIYIAMFKIKNKQLQGQLFAIIAAICGILVNYYANEVLNFPNSIITYTLMAFLFIAPYYDKELQQNESIA